MRPALLALTAAALAAIPVLALAALIAAGAASPRPALVAIGTTLLAATGLAALAARDLERLRTRLRGSAHSAPGTSSPWLGPALGSGLLWPPLRHLADELEHLIRPVAEPTIRVADQPQAAAGILQLLPDPLIVLAQDNTTVFANAAAHSAFGTDLAAVLRHPLLRGAVERAAAEHENQCAQFALAAPIARELELVAIPLPQFATPAGSTRGETSVMVVLSDRTRERAVERMRADFVANASHELRTPLATISGFIETLRGPAADDAAAQQRFLGIMAEEAARMNRLIAGLLDLSRIELAEHRAPAERVDPASLIERIAAVFEPRFAANGRTLALEVEPGLPELRGDADQLTQVLQNLLDNALRHADGTVRLTAALSGGGRNPTAAPASSQGPSRWPARTGVVIAVSDEGPGIPREHLPRLTERFYRVEGRKRRGDDGRPLRSGNCAQKHGTGLGLAIVKHIVNRHRGTMVIESEEGSGSTFGIWLAAD